jgi:succinate dehydrogenase / fumarate reductase iron-sulfur subunit
MAEFRLPAHSRIDTAAGKVYPAPSGASRVRTFRVYRFDPSTGQNPRIDSYQIDMARCGPGACRCC